MKGNARPLAPSLKPTGPKGTPTHFPNCLWMQVLMFPPGEEAHKKRYTEEDNALGVPVPYSSATGRIPQNVTQTAPTAAFLK